MARILVLDDEPSMRTVLQIGLKHAGHAVEVEEQPANAVARIREGRYDLVISDLKMPAMSGIDVLRQSRPAAPDTQFIFVTAYASSDSAIEAVKLGAFDYITKPFDIEELKRVASRALERRGDRQRGPGPGQKEKDRVQLIGVSPPMLRIYKLIGTLSGNTSTVLITGDSGTGKELVARAIHDSSSRKGMPFVSVNCGAFPETLLESELFGYAKGAFTGATRDKKGLFECAEKGTLFLDEVGEMSLAMQVKLLRVLQERRLRPVGSLAEIPVDVRLIAATNRDLREQIRQEQFREDLYYRIAVIPLHIPPLRERLEDLELLAAHFLSRFAGKMGKRITGIEPQAMHALKSYAWPGNVRELENAIERAVALESTDRIRVERLPVLAETSSRPTSPSGEETLSSEGMDLDGHLRETEKRLILAALAEARWNQVRAARLLNLSYRSLRHRIETLRIQKPADGSAEAQR